MLKDLKEAGIDVDEALERFMNNSSLYERMLKSFVKMAEEADIGAGIGGGYDEYIARVHALKGAAGNLSIKPLYAAYTEIVRLLRAKEPEKALALVEETLPEQEKITGLIKEL